MPQTNGDLKQERFYHLAKLLCQHDFVSLVTQRVPIRGKGVNLFAVSICELCGKEMRRKQYGYHVVPIGGTNASE